MNIPKKRPHYQAIRAFADGWTIQCRDPHSKNPKRWRADFNDFDVSYNFRIVPDKDGWIPFYAHEESECPVDGEVVVVVEWVDDWVVKTKKTKANEIEWDDIDNPITRYHMAARTIVEEPKTKMWQWVIQEKNNLLPKLTDYFYKDEDISSVATGENWKVIQKADWTEIEIDTANVYAGLNYEGLNRDIENLASKESLEPFEQQDLDDFIKYRNAILEHLKLLIMQDGGYLVD